jgi:hypothetical protein
MTEMMIGYKMDTGCRHRHPLAALHKKETFEHDCGLTIEMRGHVVLQYLGSMCRGNATYFGACFPNNPIVNRAFITLFSKVSGKSSLT